MSPVSRIDLHITDNFYVIGKEGADDEEMRWKKEGRDINIEGKNKTTTTTTATTKIRANTN